MTKIAFITPPFLGHFHPTISIGKELIKRGNSVYWINTNEKFMELIPAGGNFIKIKSFTPEAINDFGIQSLQKLYENVLIPLNKFMYYEIMPYIKSVGFDLIITDHQAFAGAILATEFNIPFVTSVTAPAAIESSSDFPEIFNFECEQIKKLQQYFGINKEFPLVCSSPLTLVYSTTLFLQSYNFPLSYQFVGPSIQERIEPDIPVNEIDLLDSTLPRILITVGSILKCDETFVEIVIEAFQHEKVNIILIADPKLRNGWPKNFLVYPYIPQLEVLKKVQAVICHAGYNTVCETLSFGLPLITLPVMFDQSYVATKVAKCGAGIRLKYRRLKSKYLKDSLMQLLSNPDYSNAAQKIKKSFDDAGGAKRASDLIEQLINN
jgi:MGT family glycosyltransferase